MAVKPLTVKLPWPPKELSPNARVHWTEERIAELRALYPTHSQKELAEIFGVALSNVRGRCSKLGLATKVRPWSDDDVVTLKSAYCAAVVGCEIGLDDLARLFGRDKANVCRKARSLGLTDKSRDIKAPQNRKVRKPKYATKEELAKSVSERMRRYILENGHPRGALGMRHTEEAKRKISEKAKAWNAQLDDEKKAEYLMKALKTKEKNGTLYMANRERATWAAGWREIGGTKKYYRSMWEANYARYLDWLKERGEIESWEHEPETFWFDGVRRGCVSYLPDFRVVERGGHVVYHEVKGWMDERSKTKIRRMAKYHPDKKLIIIDGKAYAAIKKAVRPMIVGWEVDSKGR